MPAKPRMNAPKTTPEKGAMSSAINGRALRTDDFERFDLLVAMDGGHLRELRRRCPAALQHKISLLPGEIEVPDPYYGGAVGFEQVLDLLESGCGRLTQIAASRLA